MAYSSPDYDNPWKEILEEYFPDFIGFYFPAAGREIDWRQGYEFLDNELRQIAHDAEIGRRYVDKLVRVRRTTGREEWVLVHVEIQSGRDPQFEERMYVYNNRIYDKYRRHVASFVVLADASDSWRPGRFEYELWQSRVLLEFPSVKLLDWKSRLDEEEMRRNMFGVVTAAHLRTLETRGNDPGRLRWKIALVQSLYDTGYTRRQVLDLFRFIDWIMLLPLSMKEDFYHSMELFEREKKMPYITSVERMGMERGIERGLQEGLQKGLREALLDTLQVRFSEVPRSLASALERINSVDRLKGLHRTALTVETLAEFARLVASSETDAR